MVDCRSGGVWSLRLHGAVGGPAEAQQRSVPPVLQPWRDWVTWDDPHLACPTPYNASDQRVCFWPSRLSLSADGQSGRWNVEVVVFAETWVPLPGNDDAWPITVRVEGEPVAVVERDGVPSVQLPAGQHQISGEFQWDQMPQRVAIPRQVGLLSLEVNGTAVPIPNWDENGDLWLQRIRAEVADRDLVTLQVYRVVEDGIPMWLRTEIELTVSGKSREEELGWVLPEGWQLSLVDSPLPVAVDDQGRMKAQVRPGKWTISLHAFRTVDLAEFQYPSGAQPMIDVELIGFRADPEFRSAEFEGLPAIDVSQTTFPEKWRDLPVYQWTSHSSFRLVEKMRGMGLQRPAGLAIRRRLWLDEDGRGMTFRDRIQGSLQQLWRLDVAPDHQLGAVRINDEGQLITVNPQTEARGVELRTRNLNLEAIGRMEGTHQWSAVGWQADAESLGIELSLPPGWRMLALFGADQADGDWLTAWSLLDLFLLLIFTFAVCRMWGIFAGLVAFLAFALSYHEPGSPRLTWLFLLMPLALLRVVSSGAGHRLAKTWQYLAIALLALSLIPFVAFQVQSVIYPQLEVRGVPYRPRGMFPGLRRAYQGSARLADLAHEARGRSDSLGRSVEGSKLGLQQSKYKASNLMYEPQAKIQTGPAEPAWSWNTVYCAWNGPVSGEQQVRPIWISAPWHRVLTVVRVVLLLLLVAVMSGFRQAWMPFPRRAATAAWLLAMLFCPAQSSAQIPDPALLETLRERVSRPSDAYPRAAEVVSASLRLRKNAIKLRCEIHTALQVAVPLPGRIPEWSPVSVQIGDQPAAVCRRDGYLWAVVPPGVHQIVVDALLPETQEWEWSFLLKPRRVEIDAPEWTVTGLRPNGIPEQQVFFSRQRETIPGEATYDRRNFQPIVAVHRHLEVGLIWQVRSEVVRLSAPGRAITLRIPLLPGENVLTANVVANDGLLEVGLGANQERFAWESELAVGDPIRLSATATNQWVEVWHLVTSPVWNVRPSGLAPIFAADEESLTPVWHPWPGEDVTLTFSKPQAVSGDTVTIQHALHEMSLGRRQRDSHLKMDVECSLGNDFAIELAPDVRISSLEVDGRQIPVRLDGARLMVPLHPGRQSIGVNWSDPQPLRLVVHMGNVRLPVDSANVTTMMRVPDSRWVLWAAGPMRGPAVRFWTVVVCAVLAALILGSLRLSPLRRGEWVLLALGLTQVHVSAALIVVGWFFILALRGRQDFENARPWRFNLRQIFIVLLTFVMLAILVVVVGEGLLGDPKMFIVGNQSTPENLQWFQPRGGQTLPQPFIVSVSVWFYRLLMLFWALWLATSLLRWLKWGWQQYSQGACWKRRERKGQPIGSPTEALP